MDLCRRCAPTRYPLREYRYSRDSRPGRISGRTGSSRAGARRGPARTDDSSPMTAASAPEARHAVRFMSYRNQNGWLDRARSRVFGIGACPTLSLFRLATPASRQSRRGSFVPAASLNGDSTDGTESQQLRFDDRRCHRHLHEPPQRGRIASGLCPSPPSDTSTSRTGLSTHAARLLSGLAADRDVSAWWSRCRDAGSASPITTAGSARRSATTPSASAKGSSSPPPSARRSAGR